MYNKDKSSYSPGAILCRFDDNNLFARIIRGEIPSNRVYEDDFTLAVHDIAPLAKVHVLALCKGNFVTFDDLIANASPEVSLGFMRGINKTIEILGLKENGYRLITNARKNGRQEIFHLHVHILGGQSLVMPEKSL